MEAAPTIAPAPPQHMQALARANQVRLARARLKRELMSGMRRADEVVLHCPEEAESMTMIELLSAQRGWGRKRSRHLREALMVGEHKQVGALVERQRRMIADALRGVRVVAG
jgi:hypothetical protein